MFPSKFDYHRAESVDHALSLLAEHPGADILSGGHSLIPTMKSGLANPDALVDIGDIAALDGIERGDGETRIGANTRYATLANDDDLWRDATVLAEAAHAVGDTQVRNRGTIGGNLAHSDPASDLPAAAIAADATLVARGPDGEREIAADDFFWGMYATELADDEILTAIRLPHHGAASGYVKKPSPSSGYAMVGVAAALRTDGDSIESARVAANGVMDHAVRLTPVEEALAGATLEESTLESAAARADEDLDEMMMMDDIQASAEFRAHLLGVYTERALTRAAERVGENPTA